MNCKKCRKLIHLYLDDAIAPQEREAMFSHLERCEGCSSYYEEMTELCDRLYEEDRELPYAFSTAWRAEVREKKTRRKGINLKIMIPALAACMCGVFVVSTAILNPEAFGGGLANLVSNQTRMERSAMSEQEPAAGEAAPAADLTEGAVPQPQEPEPALEDESGGMLEESTVQTPESDVSSGSVSDAAPAAGALLAPTPSQPQPAGAFAAPASENGDGGNAVMQAPVFDASGQKLKNKIKDFAVQLQVTVTDTADGLVLEANAETLTKILVEFQLGVATDQQAIKILCEV